jgi:hypothetical protein
MLQLSGAQQEEFEQRVERQKAQGRSTARQIVRLANPKATVYSAANVGDQPWDLAESDYFAQMPKTQVRRMEEGGHHVVALPDGAIGLKLDGEDLGLEGLLPKAATKFKRALLKRCGEQDGKRSVGIVVFDIDDTLLRAPEDDDDPDADMVQVEPVVQVLHDIVDHPKLPDLAKHWGCRKPMPDHRILPFLVTARPYSLEDFEMCVHELLNGGVRLPRSQCLFMRPGEIHEVRDGPL